MLGVVLAEAVWQFVVHLLDHMRPTEPRQARASGTFSTSHGARPAGANGRRGLGQRLAVVVLDEIEAIPQLLVGRADDACRPCARRTGRRDRVRALAARTLRGPLPRVTSPQLRKRRRRCVRVTVDDRPPSRATTRFALRRARQLRGSRDSGAGAGGGGGGASQFLRAISSV